MNNDGLKRASTPTFLVMATVGLLASPMAAHAQGHGGGGGGAGGGGQETGCGDVFGDLVHIKRNAATGQPILQKRWIEYPGDVYDWGYCPIAVDATGQEIDFVPLTCDPIDPSALVEVDYFGRLSAGRTKERNLRMHFDEVIVGIKEAESVRQDAAGRLELGTYCGYDAGGVYGCGRWRVIDSPLENLGLYVRLMRYGHLQTDPAEVDIWAHGDPALGTQYHPALDGSDYAKFTGEVRHLLPGTAGKTTQAAICFPASGFNPACARTEALISRDFMRGAAFLGGAAGKEGYITVDLVQYMNRILKLTQATETSQPTHRTLPALIRDCGNDPENPLPVSRCTIVPATPNLPWPANELFVDFHFAAYARAEWFDHDIRLLRPVGAGTYIEDNVYLMSWLRFANGPEPTSALKTIKGFVLATSDALRTNQLIHEYGMPTSLGWNFQ
jgi:hypothetical protein